MEGQTKGGQQNEETATPDGRYVLLGREGGRKNIQTDVLPVMLNRKYFLDGQKYKPINQTCQSGRLIILSASIPIRIPTRFSHTQFDYLMRNK